MCKVFIKSAFDNSSLRSIRGLLYANTKLGHDNMILTGTSCMIDISAVIVNWNTKQFLIECIDSLIKNTKKHSIEIIVVDNASVDDSVEAVRKLFPFVKVIQNTSNLGFAKANNIGIKESSGRYVCLVNSDIKLVNDAIDLMIHHMDEHASIGVLGPKTLNPDMSLRLNCRRLPSLWNTFCQASGLSRIFPQYKTMNDNLMTYFPHDVIKSVDILPGCFLMVRRKALSEVGLLDEKFFIYGEDKDWCKRFKEAGWKIIFFPSAEVIHYAGKSSEKEPDRFIIEKLKANLYYWEKHHNKISKGIFWITTLVSYLFRLLHNIILYFRLPAERNKNVLLIKERILCLRWLIRNRPKVEDM